MKGDDCEASRESHSKGKSFYLEILEQKVVRHGVEVDLSPCASGSVRFVIFHKYLSQSTFSGSDLSGLQILFIAGADRHWKYRGVVPARRKPY